MNPSVVIKPEALDEAFEAVAWYERQRAGLGLEFMAEIDRLTREIAERAESYALWSPDHPFRRANTERFPYGVFFVIEEARIVIFAIAHSSRRPGYWISRST